jgi:hypothetical protein
MKGSIKAKAVGPPIPGRIPTQNPTRIPSSMKAKECHAKTCINPAIKDSTIDQPLFMTSSKTLPKKVC